MLKIAGRTEDRRTGLFEIRECRGGLFAYLLPVLVTGIQPDQVLGLKKHFPRRRRGAAGSL
ncbi:hypothetical protein CN172_13745 [Sinorhizobium meliloti]|nr:hypothetical protein CN172_13745 [Sinorhizobium meliloti]